MIKLGGDCMIEYLDIAMQALTAIATVASVLWAIHVYRKANEDRIFLQIKNSIIQVPQICHDINFLLTEPFFAAIGNSVAEELKSLYSADQSLEDFSEFLLNDEASHNYKGLAIYSGLKQCVEVTQIKGLIKDLQDAERVITAKLPFLGKAFSKLSFYITEAAKRTISSSVLNRSMMTTFEDGTKNEPFNQAVKAAAETGTPELYFKELAVFITEVSQSSLRTEHLGQRTIDLSHHMLKISGDIFGLLTESELKKASKYDLKLQRKGFCVNNRHAVEDAMEILKKYKKRYGEEQWDKLIEYKGRIIELMESADRDND